MPPATKPPPLRPLPFDPYNCSSTGHQRAESRLATSVSWRDSRTRKLTSQLADTSGSGGNSRLFDTVGAGSEFFGRDGRKENGSWEKGAEGLRREMGVKGIKGWLIGGVEKKAVEEKDQRGKKRKFDFDGDEKEVAALRTREATLRRKDIDIDIDIDVNYDDGDTKPTTTTTNTTSSTHPAQATSPAPSATTTTATPLPPPPPSPSALPTSPSPPIFRNCTFYLNCTTSPHTTGISDHRLRTLLIQHGGSLCLGLARKKVTHVIISNPSTPPSHVGGGRPAAMSVGVGGGLAASKIHKELTRKLGGAGGGVRYVGVEWVLECIGLGRRVRERLDGGKIGAGGLVGGRKEGIESFFLAMGEKR